MFRKKPEYPDIIRLQQEVKDAREVARWLLKIISKLDVPQIDEIVDRYPDGINSHWLWEDDDD